MAQNFLPCDRDQELLLPPSLREWLPEDHLAWFVLDSVAELELGAFYAAYRADGHGAAAFDPQMMVALLVYAYAIGLRSSRGIERRCRDDVAFRVITANQVPDHATIARFRQRHERAIEGLFGSVLELCAEAGLVRAGLVAIDGTKVQANASRFANRGYEQIAREILEQAAEVDQAEDELYGEARGDELPPSFAPSTAARAGCARPSGASMSAAPRRRGRSRARGRGGWGVQAPTRGGAGRRAVRGRPPRGVLGARRALRRPSAGAAAQALQATRAARREDQPHRSRLAQPQVFASLCPGLQRPGRGGREPDRARRRGDRRLGRLRPPRADGRRRPVRTRAGRRQGETRRSTNAWRFR